MDSSLARARAWCVFAYVVAFAVAAGVIWLAPIESSFWLVAAADVAATIAVFAFSVRFDNSSFYDAYWSVPPIVMAGWWLYEFGDATPRKLAVLILVAAWGVRLTYNWLRHWKGLSHEDWRYIDLRKKTGAFYWVVSFLGIHLYPTAQVLAGCAAVYVVMSTRSACGWAVGWLDAVAVVATAAAIAIETIADQQLHAFTSSNTDPARILDSGLWSWSRHPNYFGEMLFWWGLCLFGLATRPDAWWCAIGATSISAMFLFISIPLIEQRMLAKRPHYRETIERISRVVLWPPKG